MENIIETTASDINVAMSRVYAYMTGAVMTSLIVSYLVGSSPELLKFLFTGGMAYVVMFLPLVFVFFVPMILESGISKLTAIMVLNIFAALMGLSFSLLLTKFTGASIVTAFMGTAVLFGTMSFYGYFTKRSLESLGQFLMIGVIALIIVSIINIFIGSTIMQMLISAVAIVIFLGLTAVDTQQIREEIMYNYSETTEVRGALTLYLDFINIFINLLQLTGIRNEE